MKKETLLIGLLLFTANISYSCTGSQSADSTMVAADSLAIEPSAPRKATLYFVGDAMQHQMQFNRAKLLGNGSGYDYSECFAAMAPIASAADYAVVNLELPLGGGAGGYTGYPCFSAPDSYAEALKDAGFDMFLTANNHTLDRHDEGLRRTLSVLDSLQVDHVGTYRDKAERDSLVPLIKDINGFKIAFLNYTYGTNGIMARKGAEVSLIDKEAMAREIDRARARGAELVTVCIHWGDEYHLTQNKTQENLAGFLLDQGVDLIIGGHPHVIQPMELVDNPVTGKKSLVVYSLGNFISNMTKTDTLGGASVWCELERDDDGTARLSDAKYDLYFTVKPTSKSENYRVVPSSAADSIPQGQQAAWKAFSKNAKAVFDSKNKGVGAVNR